jgi:hypothetical protein
MFGKSRPIRFEKQDQEAEQHSRRKKFHARTKIIKKQAPQFLIPNQT